jgi:hypothetical protein
MGFKIVALRYKKFKTKRIMKKLFVITFSMLGLSLGVSAQSTESATATATMIAPISITKSVDMNFGKVAGSSTAGTAVLAPAGTRSVTGGVSLPATPGTVAAASFTVNGEGTSTYAITLPTAAYTITKTASTETMTVDTFTSSPSGTGTLAAGTQTLNVGATLNVAAGQVAGTYTNSTGFDVTVNYN